MKLTEEQLADLRYGSSSFTDWWSRSAAKKIKNLIFSLPAKSQGNVHDVVKSAYRAGFRRGLEHERDQNKPIIVGGKN